jgi:DNA polymerase-1
MEAFGRISAPMTKTLLIDGDMLAYRNSAALQQEACVEWGDGVTSSVDVSWKGHSRMDRFIERLVKRLSADGAVICLSSNSSFRRALDFSYKSNRDDKQRPDELEPFKDYLRTKHGAVVTESLEADDVMGIMATDPSNDGVSVIVTIDKDLRQIPCSYYNPYPHNKQEPIEEQITEKSANEFFFYQVLVGDIIDGYKGCRGIGPTKAHRILSSVPAEIKAQWQAVVAAYISKGMGEHDALLNARMARILRYEDYDPKQGVKLWTPPS